MSPMDGSTSGTKMAIHFTDLETNIQSALLEQQIVDPINAEQKEAQIKFLKVWLQSLKLVVSVYFL